MVAPGMPASGTCRTLPAGFASRKTGCWPRLLATVEPMAMIVPAGATAAPITASVAALPSDAVDRQEVPVPVLV